MWYDYGIEQLVSLKPKLITVKCSSFFFFLALLLTGLHYFAPAHCLCQADMSIITNIWIFFFSRQAFLAFPWFTNFNSPHISSSSSLKFLCIQTYWLKTAGLLALHNAKLLLEGNRFHLHPLWILHADFSKNCLEQQDILKLFDISTLKTCFSRLESLLGFLCVTRHIQTFLLLPMALLP